MASETDLTIATRVMSKGLHALEAIIDKLSSLPYARWDKGHVRDIADAVRAASVVAKDEREQLLLERQGELSVEQLRDLLREYLANLPATEMGRLIADAQEARSAKEPRV